jgi:predicted Rossmann fold nucleotide-binding protein DprA/Smf involved in DNA uptake
MKIAITGHVNIEKANNKKMINFRKYNEEIFNKVYKEIDLMMKQIFKDLPISKNNLVLISGMARGVDEIFALYAIENNINLFLAIPYKISWHMGRKESALNYDKILEYAKNSSGFEEIKKGYKNTQNAFFARNQYMVDIADIVISYSKYNSSGVIDTIKRAKKAEKYYGNITDLLKI